MVTPPDEFERTGEAPSWRVGIWLELDLGASDRAAVGEGLQGGFVGVGPEPFPGSGDGPTAPWATVEQDPTGHWWVTVTDDTSTTAAGPFLDEVQALRALHTWDPT